MLVNVLPQRIRALLATLAVPLWARPSECRTEDESRSPTRRREGAMKLSGHRHRSVVCGRSLFTPQSPASVVNPAAAPVRVGVSSAYNHAG